MTEEQKKASEEQIKEAQQLLLMAGFEPGDRLECEGIIGLGLEEPVLGLIEELKKYIAEKEEAYQEYKKTVKEVLVEEMKSVVR